MSLLGLDWVTMLESYNSNPIVLHNSSDQRHDSRNRWESLSAGKWNKLYKTCLLQLQKLYFHEKYLAREARISMIDEF